MNNRKKLRPVTLLLCIFLVLLPSVALADTGPKPSINIRFENMGDELCYATLLCNRESLGPFRVWSGNEDIAKPSGYNDTDSIDLDSWKAFAEYKDPDGYRFLQETWIVSETEPLCWTYLTPNTFKLLLYYPETETFASSEVYEEYAFDSYFVVDMAGVDTDTRDGNPESNYGVLIARRDYNFGHELFTLLARIILTILIEMGVALLFGFHQKKQLILLIVVNTITQIILNVLLNLVNYTMGEYEFYSCYIIFELAVFAIEAILYCYLMKKVSEYPNRNRYYIIYSFVANAASYLVGLHISKTLPKLF